MGARAARFRFFNWHLRRTCRNPSSQSLHLSLLPAPLLSTKHHDSTSNKPTEGKLDPSEPVDKQISERLVQLLEVAPVAAPQMPPELHVKRTRYSRNLICWNFWGFIQSLSGFGFSECILPLFLLVFPTGICRTWNFPVIWMSFIDRISSWLTRYRFRCIPFHSASDRLQRDSHVLTTSVHHTGRKSSVHLPDLTSNRYFGPRAEIMADKSGDSCESASISSIYPPTDLPTYLHAPLFASEEASW